MHHQVQSGLLPKNHPFALTSLTLHSLYIYPFHSPLLSSALFCCVTVFFFIIEMDKFGVVRRILCLCVCFAPIFLLQCDATRTIHQFKIGKHLRSSNTKSQSKIHRLKKMDTYTSNTDPYVSSPFSLPPYESLPPFPSPDNAPPYCVYPPSIIPTPGAGAGGGTGYTPLPPPSSPGAGAGTGYTPMPPPSSPGAGGGTGYTPLPPPSSTLPPNPPTIVPISPPSAFVPTPTEPVFGPPYYEPSPPSIYVPVPAPTGYVPSPKFLPPIVYPPPAVPPPPHRTPTTAMWCVAKAAVPDPIIQEAMDYACGSGADCEQIQPSGSCFMPNTLFAHASYAFNSYWQRSKVAGGRCDFGGTAILVTVDPSYDGCHFLYF